MTCKVNRTLFDHASTWNQKTSFVTRSTYFFGWFIDDWLSRGCGKETSRKCARLSRWADKWSSQDKHVYQCWWSNQKVTAVRWIWTVLVDGIDSTLNNNSLTVARIIYINCRVMPLDDLTLEKSAARHIGSDESTWPLTRSGSINNIFSQWFYLLSGWLFFQKERGT